MDIEKVRAYCLDKPQTEESFPFNETILVFKVCGKMFALLGLEPPFRINLKCDPDRSILLREEYEEIIPGYHMNKKHWNTISLEGNLQGNFIMELIDHSFELIAANLPKNKRQLLGR